MTEDNTNPIKAEEGVAITTHEERGSADGEITAKTGEGEQTATDGILEDAKKEIEDADEVNSIDLENAPLENGKDYFFFDYH